MSVTAGPDQSQSKVVVRLDTTRHMLDQASSEHDKQVGSNALVLHSLRVSVSAAHAQPWVNEVVIGSIAGLPLPCKRAPGNQQRDY